MHGFESHSVHFCTPGGERSRASRPACHRRFPFFATLNPSRARWHHQRFCRLVRSAGCLSRPSMSQVRAEAVGGKVRPGELGLRSAGLLRAAARCGRTRDNAPPALVLDLNASIISLAFRLRVPGPSSTQLALPLSSLSVARSTHPASLLLRFLLSRHRARPGVLVSPSQQLVLFVYSSLLTPHTQVFALAFDLSRSA